MAKTPENSWAAIDDALATLLEPPIAYHACLVPITGSVNSAILLSQILFWSGVAKTMRPTGDAVIDALHRGGWFYRTSEEWKVRTGPKRDAQDTARKKLEDRRLVLEQKRGIPPKIWFKPDTVRLRELLLESRKPDTVRLRELLLESRKSICGNPANWNCGKPAKQTTGNPQNKSGETREYSSESTPEKTSESAAPCDQAKIQGSEALVSVENGERLSREIKKLAASKGLPANGRPTEPLRAELYDGIFRKGIADAFFDLQSQPWKVQLRDCIAIAVRSLMNNRVGKMMRLDFKRVERATLKKLEIGQAALARISDFTRRRNMVTTSVVRCAVDSAAELLEAEEKQPAFRWE